MHTHRHPTALALAATLAAIPAAPTHAQAVADEPAVLPPVQVTATRVDGQGFDVPASIARVAPEDLRDLRTRVQFADWLAGVPGVLARDRQNQAQDAQISMRGFGARASFGIRGVRLIVDGIPATMPDGQGQISHLALGSIASVEVLSGPYSALYGNASGGVIQVSTEDGAGPPSLSLGSVSGSDGLMQTSGKLSGEFGGQGGAIGYVLEASRFESAGYRQHSSARRNILNAKLTHKDGAGGRWSLIVNHLDMPWAKDPMGLNRSQLEQNPRAVDPAALNFNTRKSVDQSQLGQLYELPLAAGHVLRLMAYGGQRRTEQFQSIPVATQANVLHPGGVIDLARSYAGSELRWTQRRSLLDSPLTLVYGLSLDGLQEHRRGYQNFVGTQPGERGALRRDERNRIQNVDPYAQLSWRFAPGWVLDAGLRHSRVLFRSIDHYVVGRNADDSGSQSYSATLPMLALGYQLNPRLRLHASASRGFETPTLNELAYRTNGDPGLNLGLRPSRSLNLEVGLKAKLGSVGELTAALFKTRSRDEIVTASNAGGRASFQNAGATRRQGLELALAARPLPDLQGRLAYTWLDARYLDAFATCTAAPCTTPQTITAGGLMPGLPRSQLSASLNWTAKQGWQGGLSMRALGRVMADDLNTSAAPGFGLLDAQLGYLTRLGGWEVRSTVQLNNLADKRSVGSVIVNEANKRFFEPAAGRIWSADLSAHLAY